MRKALECNSTNTITLWRMERLLCTLEMELSIQYHVTIINQLNYQNVTRYYIILVLVTRYCIILVFLIYSWRDIPQGFCRL